MARIYAGILGSLAFVTAVARGVIHGGDVRSVLWLAWFGLLAFSAAGYVIGRIAESTLSGAIRDQIAKELAAKEDSS